MQRLVVTCDECGKEIEFGKHRFTYGLDCFDLCTDCLAGGTQAWLNTLTPDQYAAFRKLIELKRQVVKK